VCACAAAAAIFAPTPQRAEACSCAGPRAAFLSPKSAAAPLNTHARVEVPASLAGRTFVLRAHRGPVVPTTAERLHGRDVVTIDLTPTAPLARETRYEVAAIDTRVYPSTLVIGTFVTGTSTDTTAPLLPSLGRLRTHMASAGGGLCSAREPWITFEGTNASDPGRPDADLGYAVWRLEKNAAVDTRRPPDAFLASTGGAAVLGSTSVCDPHPFDLSGRAVDLVVAAVDEAGNRSPARKVHVDLTKASP